MWVGRRDSALFPVKLEFAEESNTLIFIRCDKFRHPSPVFSGGGRGKNRRHRRPFIPSASFCCWHSFKFLIFKSCGLCPKSPLASPSRLLHPAVPIMPPPAGIEINDQLPSSSNPLEVWRETIVKWALRFMGVGGAMWYLAAVAVTPELRASIFGVVFLSLLVTVWGTMLLPRLPLTWRLLAVLVSCYSAALLGLCYSG